MLSCIDHSWLLKRKILFVKQYIQYNTFYSSALPLELSEDDFRSKVVAAGGRGVVGVDDRVALRDDPLLRLHRIRLHRTRHLSII